MKFQKQRLEMEKSYVVRQSKLTLQCCETLLRIPRTFIFKVRYHESSIFSRFALRMLPIRCFLPIYSNWVADEAKKGSVYIIVSFLSCLLLKANEGSLLSISLSGDKSQQFNVIIRLDWTCDLEYPARRCNFWKNTTYTERLNRS